MDYPTEVYKCNMCQDMLRYFTITLYVGIWFRNNVAGLVEHFERFYHFDLPIIITQFEHIDNNRRIKWNDCY
jgi:hypothetical protein